MTRRPAELLLVVVLVASPLFAAVAHYPDRDCDDKATHFYCGAYSAADSATRTRLAELVSLLEARLGSERDWPAVEFRIQSPRFYPVSSWLIGLFASDVDSFSTSIRAAFAIVLCVSFFIVVVLCATTPLGLLRTLAILDLAAALGAVGMWLQVLPGDVVPFLTYAPRGASALFFLVVVASVSSRRYGLGAFALAASFALHVGLGGTLALTCVASAVLTILSEKVRRLRTSGDFEERMVVFCAFFVFVVIAVVTPIMRNAGLIVSIAPDREWMLHEIPRRFFGAGLIAFGALAIVAIERAVGAARGRQALVVIGIVAAFVLSALSVRRVTARFSFAHDSCGAHRPLPLPESLARLSSSDRPEVMLSLAAFLLAGGEESEDRNAGADRDEVLDERIGAPHGKEMGPGRDLNDVASAERGVGRDARLHVLDVDLDHLRRVAARRAFAEDDDAP